MFFQSPPPKKKREEKKKKHHAFCIVTLGLFGIKRQVRKTEASLGTATNKQGELSGSELVSAELSRMEKKK